MKYKTPRELQPFYDFIQKEGIKFKILPKNKSDKKKAKLMQEFLDYLLK